MHAIEKILAKNSGRAEVHTGEIEIGRAHV